MKTFITTIPNSTEGNFDWAMRFNVNGFNDAPNLPNEVYQLVSEIPADDQRNADWKNMKDY